MSQRAASCGFLYSWTVLLRNIFLYILSLKQHTTLYTSLNSLLSSQSPFFYLSYVLSEASLASPCMPLELIFIPFLGPTTRSASCLMDLPLEMYSDNWTSISDEQRTSRCHAFIFVSRSFGYLMFGSLDPLALEHSP